MHSLATLIWHGLRILAFSALISGIVALVGSICHAADESNEDPDEPAEISFLEQEPLKEEATEEADNGSAELLDPPDDVHLDGTEDPDALEPPPEIPTAYETEAGDTAPPAQRLKAGWKAFVQTGDAPDGKPGIEPIRFLKVQPGTTTMADVYREWGDAVETIQEDEQTVSTYSVTTFENVEVRFSGDVVSSIAIHLKEPIDAKHLASLLGLEKIRPVDVHNARGRPIGRAFPERGVLFSFGVEVKSFQVDQIVLESIDPETFVLRAERQLQGPYTANLRDLEYAIQQDETYGYAHWLRAEVLLVIGKAVEAEQAASTAVQLDPDAVKYRLTWAGSLARTGRHEQSIEETKQALNSPSVTKVVKAQALAQLGELISRGGTHDFKQSIKYHLQAIKLAHGAARGRNLADRRAAMEVLVESHLAIARDIAWGRWRQKSRVVPMWLERASHYADELIENQGAGEIYRLWVAQQALLALAGFQPAMAPAHWVKTAERAAKVVADESADPLWKELKHWQLGMVYFHAVQIEHVRSQFKNGLKYGQLALKHLERGAKHRDLTSEEEHIAGRLLFQIGALHAVHRQDHDKAVDWFEKAAPALVRPLPISTVTDPRRHGDALVSMGVTYWEVGQKEKAVELTKLGAEMIQQAIASGIAQEKALAVPYGNLAAMHEALGDDERAQDFAEMAARWEAMPMRR